MSLKGTVSSQTDPKREITRAERVRARRQAEKAKGKRKPMASQRDAHAQPAVKINQTTAQNPFARPVHDNRRKSHAIEGGELIKPSVNRRITIPLNQKGAEIEFSTLPVMNMGWRLLSAIVTASMIVALGFLIFATRIKAPQVKGLSPLLTAELIYYLDMEDQPIFLIEPTTIKEKIQQAFPEIEAINVKIQFPDKILITAEARQPQYAWVIDERVYLIDNQGTFYPAEPGTSTDGLIVVDAHTMPEMKLEFEQSEDIIVEILEYTSGYSASDEETQSTFRGDSFTVDPSVVYALEQILHIKPSEAVLKYDQRHGFGWQDPNGWNAYFGFDLEQIDMKFAVYESIRKKLGYQGIEVELISVEYLHAPYYRED